MYFASSHLYIAGTENVENVHYKVQPQFTSAYFIYKMLLTTEQLSNFYSTLLIDDCPKIR